MSRGRRIMALAVGALVAVAVPTTAFADAAGPSEFRSEITEISPPTPSIELSIVGGDSFVRIVVAPGTDVVVLGYDGEPYTWIDADGAIWENRLSYATYYNSSRYGGDVPDFVDSAAEPDWRRVGSGGAWAWHDHRAHWMASSPPLGMRPGDTLPGNQLIPLVVDGRDVSVTVVSTLMADPSPWPPIGGAVAGVAIAAVATIRRRGELAAAVLGIAALGVGLVQFLSLPAETGPRPIWWLPPAVAVVAAGLAWWWRRSPVMRLGLIVLAAAQLALWAYIRRLTFVRPVLPTDLAFWADRALSAAATSGALVLGGAAVAGIARLLRQPARASSMAASSAS